MWISLSDKGENMDCILRYLTDHMSLSINVIHTSEDIICEEMYKLILKKCTIYDTSILIYRFILKLYVVHHADIFHSCLFGMCIKGPVEKYCK